MNGHKPATGAYKYDAVISYAGEQRFYAEQLAAALKSAKCVVYYDQYELAAAWGKQGPEYFDEIYRDASRFCIVLVSKEYAAKVWTRTELRSALARGLEERASHEYILPIRFDDTDIHGLPPSILYLDAKEHPAQRVAEIFLGKLGRHVAPSPAANGKREISWLHFSDLPAYPEPEWTAVRESFRANLAELRKEHSLDWVFFTGDGFAPLPDEPGEQRFNRTEHLLGDVRACWNLTPASFYMVPGERDAAGKDPNAVYEWLTKMLQEGEQGKEKVNQSFADFEDGDFTALMHRFSSFRDYLKSAGYEQLLTQPKRLMFSNIEDRAGIRIGIAGMNTAWCAGRVGEKPGDPWFAAEHQIRHLASGLQSCDLRISLMHHPLSWGNKFEAALEPALAETFHFAVHGHEYAPPQATERHVRIGAGTSAEAASPFRYNIVKLDCESGAGSVWNWSVPSGNPANHIADSRVFEFRLKIGKGKQSKRAASKGPGRKIARSTPDTLTGIIVVCEFFDFSGHTPNSQIHALKTLWNRARALDTAPGVSPIPDGVVVTWPDDERALKASSMIEWIGRLERIMKEDRVEPGLRFAIHSDVFSQFAAAGTKPLQVLGTAVNDCLWMASLGESGHIAISDSFYTDYYRKEEGSGLVPDLSPLWEFPRRNRRYLGVRLCLRSQDDPAPYRFRLMQAVEPRIRDQLRNFEELFRFLLTESAQVNVTPRQLQARISVWEKRLINDTLMLCPTRFRYQNGGAVKFLQPGEARYFLDGAGQGPVGRAVVRGKVEACQGLPDWRANPTEYVDKLASYDLDEQAINVWQRKARSFVCFPMSMLKPPKGMLADTALCIDCADPLEPVDVRELVKIGGALRDYADQNLAPIWQLWSSR